MSPKKKTKNKSRSSRAGLRLPVGRIHRILKNGKFAPRVGVGASIYLAAVVEYLAAEILDLASEVVETKQKTRVKPRDLLYAIRNDDELNRLLAGATIIHGGVMPSINPMLLPKKTLKASKNDDSDSQASQKSQQY